MAGWGPIHLGKCDLMQANRFILTLAGLAMLLSGVACDTAHTVSPNVAKQFGSAIADTVEKVAPSVVVVRTAASRYLVDVYWGRTYRQNIPGQGSGVIINKNGYVLTSNHVIEKAEDIEIEISDGRYYSAELVGSDPLTDLAVLKIKTEKQAAFTPIDFGNSDKLRVGEFVIAVGAPFSLEQHLQGSVTLGIVSQKGRTIGLLPYEDFIQTDAPINPGNSGGPLVDVDGQMVGINTVIQKGGPGSEGNIGIGFAVPVNLAKRVSDSIIRSGSVEHPWLGITMQLNEDGVHIRQVVQGTPAEHGGLQAGDLIMAVDGEAVNDLLSVRRGVFQNDIGDTVTMKIMRGQKVIEKRITLGAMPEMLNFRR